MVAIERLRPEVVLLDIQLPDVDGYSFVALPNAEGRSIVEVARQAGTPRRPAPRP